uniref:Uncharacterized protein n=1 Tax=Asparagus officinalis TaxID=4686 RepID=Q2AA90_ASPOF|nr:hypothetical protein 17.t00028 [Asparagus officinalis]
MVNASQTPFNRQIPDEDDQFNIDSTTQANSDINTPV